MFEDQRRSGAPVPGVQLRVLGGFELRTPGGAEISAIDLDGRRLLAALAVGAAPKTRTELSAMLWPELPRVSALAALSSAKAAVADLVTENGRGLALVAEVTVDLVEALRRLREWQRDSGQALSVTAEEIATLGDDLLPSWSEAWVEQERKRFHQVRVHALESLCRRLTQAGQPESAIRAGQLVVDLDPLRESARRALIEAHLAAGNVSEAVHQYDTFVELCAALGFAPDAELRSFFPPSPAWPVLHVRRPIHPGYAVGRGVRFDAPGRRAKVGAGAAVRG
ncbi:MAG: bacterial transcriptional activator domain-containing protein [Pseudonocardia sp.]|jgi:DNA-binding SARP family transcriptional activator|nr:bacterial transcriptional activator domain-containing protein [Pseudonocardia sp.]